MSEQQQPRVQRSALDRALDIPAYFDLIDRIEGAISTFLNADWKGAYKRHGIAGLLSEFVACITSQNAPTIKVFRFTHWRGIDVERMLRKHGIKVWDRGLMGDDLYFCVKRRQLKWTEYLLSRAGVPYTMALTEPRNRVWAERYQTGDMPADHSKWQGKERAKPKQKRRRGIAGTIVSWLDGI